MSKIKKVLVLALSVALSATAFSGCGILSTDFDDGTYDGGMTDNWWETVGKPGASIVGEEVTQEEWSAAIAASLAATNVKVKVSAEMEGNMEGMSVEGTYSQEINIADGKISEESSETETLNGERETREDKDYYFAENGIYYHLSWDSRDGEWTKEPATYEDGVTSAADCCGAYILGEGLEGMAFAYSMFEYNKSTGAYEYEMSAYGNTSTIEVKVKGGKIAAYTHSTKNDDFEETSGMTITYGNASVTIPDDYLGGNGGGSSNSGSGSSNGGNSNVEEIVGEGVDADGWEAAIAATLAATNVKVRLVAEQETSENGTPMGATYTGDINIANGKISEEYVDTVILDGDENRTEVKEYYFAEDGVYYKLSWDSRDGEWTKETATDEDGVTSAADCCGAYFLGSPLGVLGSLYSMFTYNESKGAYEYEFSMGSNSSCMEIKIKDGKVVAYTATSSNNSNGETYSNTTSMTITYGNATVTIPDVQIGGGDNNGDNNNTSDILEGLPTGERVDADGWDAAVEATASADNLVITMTMSTVMSGISVSGVMVSQIADNKDYTESQTTIPSYGTQTEYTYTGNVGDYCYEWSSDDGESWDYYRLGDAKDIDGTYFLEDSGILEANFEDLVYNEESGAYLLNSEEFSVFVVGIVNGKIGFIYTESEDMEALIRITYGNASVGDLPALN